MTDPRHSQIHDGHRQAARDLAAARGFIRARELLAAWAVEDPRYGLVALALDDYEFACTAAPIAGVTV